MSRDPSRQLPLALRFPPDQRLDTYVGAPEGALAQLRVLATVPGADWCYLAGAPGTGKTHLALGACAEAEAGGRRAAYLSLRTAAGRVDEALAALEGADVVALDDVDAVAGDRASEIALFDFHNRMRAAGVALLYTAPASPDALPLSLPDLRSRLAQCTRVLLPMLDDAGRREVLRTRAQRRGLAVDDAALDWLLRRVGRDLGGLARLFDRLDRAALAAQRRITVPFLRGALGDDA